MTDKGWESIPETVMDRRTKILTTLFGTLLVCALLSSVVYPRWIEPMLKIDERIADRRTEYDSLQALEDKVKRAKKEYGLLVSRVGSLDIGKVETGIRARINELIDEHQLQGANVSPSRPTEDRKTGLKRMLITVTAVGTLKSAVEFLEDVAEFPQLVRVGNAAIYPASSSGRDKSRNRMNLRVPIEVLVLPEQKLVGRIKEEESKQPESFVRHAGRDYSLIWSKKPFTEPIPLQANAGRDVNVRQDQSSHLKGTASGGDGEYTFEWSPAEGLSDAMIPNPTIDTSEGFTRTYTLNVADADGETATDTVTVTVREKRVTQRDDPEPPQRPVDKGPPRFKDGKYMQLCMTLIQSIDTGRVAELMVSNNRSKKTEYYAVGDEFDGGELVFVHPRGGVVRRRDEYFIYPIGGWLDQDIKANAAAAADYPELKVAADRYREDAGTAPKTEEGAATPATQKDNETAKTDRAGVSTPKERERTRSGMQPPKEETSRGTGSKAGTRATGSKPVPPNRKKDLRGRSGGETKPRRYQRRPKKP